MNGFLDRSRETLPPAPSATSRPARTTAGSIRRRLTRSLLIKILLFAVISNVLLFLYLQQELVERYDEALSTEARSVASLLKTEGDRADLAELVAASFPRLHLKTGERGFLQAWRPDGGVALKTNSIGDTVYEKPSDPPKPGHVNTFGIDLPDGDGGRAAVMHLDRSEGSEAAGWIMLLGEPTTELDKTLLHITIALTLIVGGMCLFAVYLVVNGVRRELLPLESFAEAVGNVRAETLAYRFDANAVAAELQPIAARMNDLLGRLGEAFDRERRFSGNLAHELRTPVAEMRTMLEVASRWPPDAQGATHLHRELLTIAERTSTLLDALLMTTRHHHGRQPASLSPTTLRECISEAWDSTRKLAADRGITLAMSVAPDESVITNHAILVALLSNLLENAASYAARDSVVHAAAKIEPGFTTLAIENTTFDLTPADLPRLHEPFWRKDAARADRSHAGLGLALVREYAEALGCEFTLSMPSASTLSATLRWRRPVGVESAEG